MLKLLMTLSFVFASTTALGDTFEGGWDRPGYDYISFDLVNPRAILCQYRCQIDNRCRAWTYVKQGVQGQTARCWLKNKVPAPVRNTCCTSGIVQ